MLSRQKTLLLSVGIVAVFFIATRFIFPTELFYYNGGLSDIESIQFPSPPYFIENQEIYSRALLSVVPWAMFSPWAVVNISQCFDLDCGADAMRDIAFLILLFFLYVKFLAFFIQAYKEHRVDIKRRLLVALIAAWMIYTGGGVLFAKHAHVDPPRFFNHVLSRLQEISGEEPFPPGTVFYERAVLQERKGSAEFSMQYDDPHFLEEVKVSLDFNWPYAYNKVDQCGDSPTAERIHGKRNSFGGIVRGTDDVWYCAYTDRYFQDKREEREWTTIKYAMRIGSEEEYISLTTDLIHFDPSMYEEVISTIPKALEHYR